MKIILTATYLIAFASFIGGFRAPHQWFVTAICAVLLLTNYYSAKTKKHYGRKQN